MKRIAAICAALLIGFGAFAGAQSIQTQPDPGSYSHNIVLTLAAPPPDEALYYSVNIEGAKQAVPRVVRYTTPLVLSSLPGERRRYQIAIQLRKGDTLVQSSRSVWTIDRRSGTGVQAASPGAEAPPPTSIPILSPTSGSFANPQLLFVNDTDFLWVRYTTDGSDPLQNGQAYSGPAMIPDTGSVDLRIAALGKGATQPLTTNVRYSVAEAAQAPIVAKSGLYRSPVTIQAPATGDFRYSFGEHSPGNADPVFDQRLSIGAPPESVQYTVLRLRRLINGEWGPEFRYFFAVDRRSAPKPTISLLGGSIATPRTTIRIDSPPFTRVFYTTDGSEPTTASTRYTGDFTPSLPSGSKGTLIMKARAFAPNGSSSEVATTEYPYTTIPPEPPKVTLEGAQTGGPEVRILVQPPPDSVAVYERSLDGAPPPDPTRSSPKAPREMLLTLPRGASLPFSFKFASIDATGALSPPSQLFQVTVDQLPPPEPTISFAQGQLEMSAKAKIIYALSDNGTRPESLGSDPTSYAAPVALPGKANERVAYYVAAQAVGPNGLRSAVVRGGPFVVDRRTPADPIFWGITPGESYNASRTLEVEETAAQLVHYTISSNGTPPEDPTASSPVVTGPMTFSVPEGAEKSFVLKLRTIIGEKLGPVVTIPFRIDRIQPVVPSMAALTRSAPYDHSITLRPPKMPMGETLYISVSSSGTPGDPLSSAGRPFESPIQLSSPSGEQRTYAVRLAAKDSAGNTAEDPKKYLVTIDRRVPDPPQISADPAGGTVVGQVQITLSGSASAYHYVLTDDGSDPSLPSRGSKKYSAPLVLLPKNGAATVYSLSAVAESSSGNLSSPSPVYRVLVEPAAQSAGQQSPPTGSGSAKAAIPAPKEQQLLIGADNGGLYNSLRTLRAAENKEVIRYEINSNGGAPAAVTPFSPILAGDISIEPAVGETRSYQVRAAAFASRGSSAPVAEQLIGFTIDRTPPATPTISGIIDNARYQQPESFSLQAASGTIYYSLDKLTPFVSTGSLSSTRFTPYKGPVRIGVGEASARYRIHAYTIDAAGNRSKKTPEWTVYFDRGVVYTSPTGSDSNDGTSVDPVKTLRRALDLAQTRNRNTIFLASGSYSLEGVHTITAGLSILGDFDPSDWHQKTGLPRPTTFISTSHDLTAKGPLFSVRGGGLSLERVRLTDRRASGGVFSLSDGSLSVSNGSIVSTESSADTIVANKGSVSMDRVSVENQGGGSVLAARGTTVNVSGSSFAAGPTTQDSIVVSLSGGSKGSIKDSLIHPSSGLRSIALSVADSKLAIEKSELLAGSSTRQSIALFAQNADITVTGSKLVGSALSHLSFGVQAQGSNLQIDGTTVEATGSVGATGIWADNSMVHLTGSKVAGSATSEFLYLLKLTDSHAVVSSNIFVGAGTGDFLGISLTRSPARVVGNTLFGGEGTGRSSALSLESSADVAIVDNIFARRAALGGEAIRTDTALPTIIANDFAGYTTVVASPVLPNEIRTVGELNGYGSSTTIRGNVTERLDTTFRSLSSFELKTGSACIGGGVDPSAFNGDMTDFSGAVRSAPFDIGALRHR